MTIKSGPIITYDDSAGKMTVERELDLPGIKIRLQIAEHLSPRRLFTFAETHLLSLALSPLPENWGWRLFPSNRILHAGTLNFLPAGTQMHILPRHGTHKWLSMYIDRAYFAEKTGHTEGHVFEPYPNIRGTPLDAALFRIAREMSAPDGDSETVIRALLEMIFVDVGRHIVKSRKERVANTATGLNEQQLTKIREFIENADGMTPTIDDISRLLGISRRHLTRQFKLSVGQTIHSYLAGMRLKKAIHLLTSTDYPVKEIAHRLGFASAGSLAYVFRGWTGQTPTEFRQSHRAS